MDEEENLGPEAAYSELRYISLELMKLAQKSGKPFGQIAREYLENTEKLHQMITLAAKSEEARAQKSSSKEK